MNPTRGFSLIELVVVMVIAGILAAVAIPRFTDSESNATWFTEQVKAGVRYAQRQAVAQRRTVYVVAQSTEIDLCYAVNVAQQCLAPLLTNLSTGIEYRLVAPTGVTINPPTTFWFNGLGQPSGGVSLTVASHPITINAETGYVQ